MSRLQLGSQALVVFLASAMATSTWACSPAPGDVYGCGGPNDSLLNRNAPTYGTSTRIITGYDGTRHIETAPSYTPQDEVRVIDYSGDYITEDVIDQYGVHELD